MRPVRHQEEKMSLGRSAEEILIHHRLSKTDWRIIVVDTDEKRPLDRQWPEKPSFGFGEIGL
jgi:hypothetical protein